MKADAATGVSMARYLRRLVWWSMLPLVLLAVLLAADTLRRLRAADDRAAHLLVTQLTQQLDELLAQRTMGLGMLAASPLLDERRLGDFHRRSQVFRSQFGSELLLANRQGEMLLHTGRPYGEPLPPMPRPKGRAAAPAALASGHAEVGDVFVGPVAQRTMVAVAVPVVRSGTSDWVLLTSIETRAFQARIDQAGVPEGWHVALLDSQGALIAGGFGPNANAAAVEDGGVRVTKALTAAPWTVVVDESAASRRGPLLATLAALALAIVAATAVGRLAGGRGGQRLARAVAQLAQRGEPAAGETPIAEIQAAQRTMAGADAQREAALQGLREASQRFSTLFESAPVAMAVSRQHDLRLVEVNAAFEALSGHARADVLGRTSEELRLWADFTARDDAVRRVQDEGQVPLVEAQLRRRSGELVDVNYSVCIVDIAGQPHFVATILDVTLQRQARRALERQQEELEALVARRTADLEAANATLSERAAFIADLYDGAPCGYHSVSPDGIVMAVNATELALLGYSREEFVGQPVKRFMTEASQALQKKRYPQFLATGSARDMDFDAVCKDGSVLPVLVSVVMVRDAQGRHVSNRAVMVDNSERKRREQQIVAMQLELARRADEAEAANRAKSAFLANMSHEIRTPMNAILGLTHLLSRDIADPLQHNRLDKVAAAAKHLLQVINDILDLSKIEAGKMVLEDTPFQLDDLVAKAFALVEGPARAKGLELVLDTDHTPSQLRGDPTRLAQALVNLLANAVKFTASGWVRLAVEPVSSEGRNLVLRFEVRDTGEGIAAGVLPHLFEAFEQADSSTTRRHGGTGLGLALTRHIVRMMDGEVGVDSQPGQGSRFWFTVRLQRADASPRPTAGAPLAGQRALLVDDLQEALLSLRDQLRILGLQVQAFASPDAAVQLARDEAAAGRAFDLLVLDWRMGPPDGLATLALLRAVPGLAHTPAVLVTAYDDDTLRGQAQTAGFDAVLVKPITASALHDTLQQLRRDTGTPLLLPEGPAQLETLLRKRHGGCRVLVAEDNAINREVALELLSSVGLVVELAEDGVQAVDKALASPFDLVLMDMQMPLLDGLDATRQLRAAGRAQLPIVAMTANAFGEDRAACVAAGMNDHLPKPVDPERLYATLLRWLPAAAPLPTAVAPVTRPAPLLPAGVLPLQDRLAGVVGLDVSQALVNVGGQVGVLRRVLERFVQAYGAGVGPLDRELAHSLRGACAAVGAVDLQAAIQAYEAALGRSTPEEQAQQAVAVQGLLADLVQRLQAALGAGSD